MKNELIMWRMKKSKTVSREINTALGLLVTRIAGAGLSIQSRFANFLGKQTANLSARSLKLSAVIFVIAWSTATVYFVAVDFAIAKPVNTVYISHFKHAALPGSTIKEKSMPGFAITEKEFNAVRLFRKYMDSLALCNSKAYDSICLARPGLMDSIRLLEQIYNHQKK